jgi:hypothetical protein
MQAMRLERIEDMSRHQGSCVHGDKLKMFERDLPAFGFLFELQTDPHTQEALSADG